MSDHSPLDGAAQMDDSSYRADMRDMQTIADASRLMAKFEVPIFAQAGNPREKLFIASLDGTGNNVYKDREHATSVARIDDQILSLRNLGNEQLGRGYTVGVGTEDNAFKRTLDGALGYTHMQSVEEAYKQFIEQAKRWRDQDPNVQIRIAEVGFSRGAEEAVTLARLIHERGIQDPMGAVYTKDKADHITHVEYIKPPLVEPGKTPQAVALFDPVDTGEPSKYDRRLPPSVVSGIQITAKDEHRFLFKSNQIIPDGISADGRFLGVTVAGAHSDIGDTYWLNGLGLRIGNLGIDYLNSLSDKSYLQKNPEPDDPNLNVIHRSEESMLLYRMTPKVDRLKPEGQDPLLVPIQQISKVPNANEPVTATLNASLERHTVTIGPVLQQLAGAAQTASAYTPPPSLAEDPRVARLYRTLNALDGGDHATYLECLHEAANSDAGRAVNARAVLTVDREEAFAQRLAEQAQKSRTNPIRQPQLER